MNQSFQFAKTLAELLRLQRWAGGEIVPADRIFGLLCGFESVMNSELEGFGITEETQRKVEDILDDVENGKQSPDGHAIKLRLINDRIDETVAEKCVKLCMLQERFPEATELLTSANSYFNGLSKDDTPEQNWLGSLHYVELHDGTVDAHRKLHAVLSPSVPQVGDVVTPERGSPMRVVEVEWKITEQSKSEGIKYNVLIPYVYLEVEDDAATDT